MMSQSRPTSEPNFIVIRYGVTEDRFINLISGEPVDTETALLYWAIEQESSEAVELYKPMC